MKKKLLIVVAASIALLGVPVVGGLVSDDFNWSAADFIVAALLLITAGSALVIIDAKMKKNRQRILASLAVLIVFALIWAELAVGIFD